MKLLVLTLTLTSALAALAIPQTARLTAEDLRRLTGAQWTGTLSYLDYRSNKKTTIQSSLKVTRVEGNESSWLFEYTYPAEPKANGRRVVKLEEGGTVIDGETIVERTRLDGDAFKVVTEKRGKDNDRDALFRYTYTFGASSFSILKEVRPEGASEFFERNRYSWHR